MADSNRPENEIARVLSPPATLMQSASALFAVDPDLDLPAASSDPRKETARIGVMPQPVMMMKADPNTGITSRVLCWILLGASAAILIIEIWNYVS